MCVDCETPRQLIVIGPLQESAIIGLWRSAEMMGGIMNQIFEFSFVARFGAFIAMLLFVTFAFVPVIPFTMLGVAMTPEGLLMARRMAALFLGIALVLWLLRDEADGQMRRRVCLAMSASMATLALFGFYDFIRGSVGLGIWIAVSVEAYFALTLGLLARMRQ